MKLTALQIERFGTRSNLQLDDLSPRLNVVYGPNGSGKSTISHFIRWMLYGSDDPATQPFLLPSDIRLGGTLQLLDGHQRPRELRRYWDRVRGDQIQLIPDDSPGHLAWDARRLTAVDAEEYGHVFCFGFEQTPAVERLLERARTRDATPLYDPQPSQRLRELTERCEALRREVTLAPTHESATALQHERRQRQEELQALERRLAERMRQWQHDADALAVEIETDRHHGESLQAMLRRTEAAIDARREQLDRVAHQAGHVRRQWLEERRQEVAEIDYQIKQWHSVLDSVRHRQDELTGRMGPREPQPALSTPADDHQLRLFLRSLGHQLEDIEQDCREWSADEGVDERSQGDYLRSVLGAALSSMRADVHRLCRELQRQQSNALYHDHAREQDHLRRCEAELHQLIDSLDRRRQALLISPEFSEQPWLESLNGSKSSFNGRLSVRASSNEVLTGETAPPAGFYVADPVLEARLTHLVRRRDHLAARVAELATRIEQNEHRLSHLRSAQLPSDEARQRDGLQASIEDLDRRILQAEAAQRRRQELETLERQMADLRATLGPSDVVREASSIIQRLTDGSYVGIRIAPRSEVWVDDHRGHSQQYRELSRGARDQVYLSLALALVTAYRRRGVEMTMVLNDVFANIDTGRAQATAELLAQFAAQGHQLILLTRHEHVMQRFAALPAKLYTLREREQVEVPSRPAAAWRDPAVHPAPYYLDQAPPLSAAARWEAPAAVTHVEPRRTERAADWVAHWDPPRRMAPVRAEADTLVEPARASLTVDSLLSDVEWLDRRHSLRWQEHGIRTVQHLLAAEPEECQRQLSDPAVNAAMIDRWQSQLSLQCFVGLTPNDATLLIACGVDDPEELSYIDVSQLHRRIEDYLADADARHRYGSIARFERSRLARWIQAARRSHFRRTRVSGAPLPRRAHRTPPVTYRTETTERLTPRARRVDPLRAKPGAAADAEAQQEANDQPAAAPSNEELRFFLEPTDPIVDAPSIGPKTAERLNAIGVSTVADLLEVDPADAAERINYRRITSDLIRSWQLQADMVCRVPNLRGHEAQLLIACQVPGPGQLAKLEPDTLLAQINALLETPEGKRILRSAKAPDRHEITAWIRWARNAR